MMKSNHIHKEGWSKLENYLKSCVEKEVFPGADFAIVTADDIRMTSVGYRQLVPTKESNDGNTLWDLASISKVVVTTTCILKLMEEGSITLKTKVSDILPEYEHKDITIRHCVAHTSGMPADVEGYKQMSKAEIMNAIYHMPFVHEPGTKVLYSDINYILLGHIVSRLKGSLDEYAKTVMFEPLEMTHTCYNPDASLKAVCAAYEDIPARGGIVRGIVHDGKAFKFDGISGHAGVFSTMEDLTHYVQMLINDGIYKGKPFFSKATIDLLKKCQSEGLNEKRSIGWVLSDENYALGDYYSPHTLFHTGFSGSSFLIDMDRKVGFITCCNRVHPSRDNRKILTERDHIHNLAYQCI